MSTYVHAQNVTYDGYSLYIDGIRQYIWSGEFHPFRLPNPDLWRDVLQKMKVVGIPPNNDVFAYV